MLRVRGDPDHPANFGKLCPKGATVAQTVNVTHAPALRRCSATVTGGPLDDRPAETADRPGGRRLERILQTHGPGAIAFYLSGQLTTEAQYLAEQIRQGLPAHQPRRLQQPAVHGQRRQRDDAVARQRRAADVLR